MKAIETKYKQRVAALLASGFTLSAATAQAAIEMPAAVTTMFTDVATLVGTIMAASVAIWVAIKGSVVIYKLGNKFLGKAGA